MPSRVKRITCHRRERPEPHVTVSLLARLGAAVPLELESAPDDRCPGGERILGSQKEENTWEIGGHLGVPGPSLGK